MEFKELFALQRTDPIIVLGGELNYVKMDLPAMEPVNKKQQEHVVPEKIAPESPVQSPRKLTKAEQRRARQEQRQREREERQARFQREREERDEELREEMEEAERRAREALVARENAAARMNQQIAVANAPVHAAPAANAIMAPLNINDPDVRRQFEALDPGARRVKFWELIRKLNWHNASDGAIPRNAVTNMFNGCSALDMLTFKTEYGNIYNGAVDFLSADGMFDRNGADTHNARAKIVSHTIALGEDQYTTLIGDPAFLQFLIEAGECQSLNDMLPENIRV